MRPLSVIALITTVVASAHADAPFASTDFEGALAAAARDGKDVLLYFSEPGNGQCLIYADATWSDAGVREWIDEHAIALELDLPSEPAIAAKYGVDKAPAVLLLDSSGGLKARIIGFRMPGPLLAALNEASSETATHPDAAGQADPYLAKVRQGESLERQGRADEAMTMYLACIDADDDTPGLLAARRAAVAALGRLARTHPPAMATLKDRRDAVHRRIVAKEGRSSDAALFLALTQTLREIGTPPSDGASEALRRARILADSGKQAGALAAYQRILEGDEATPDSALGQKLLAIEDLGKLGRDHPPAMAVLRARRDRIRDRLLGGEASRIEPAVFVAIGEQLDDLRDCIEVCRRLKRSDPEGILTRLLRDTTARALVAVGRYAEAADLIDAVAAIRVARAQLEKDLAGATPPGKSAESVHHFLRRQFVEHTVPLYEMLVGAGRADRADVAAADILEAANDAETSAALAAAGLRTMKPVDANVEQARRALTLGDPGDVERIELLVLILQTLDRNDEAQAVVENHIERVEGAESKRALRRLVDLTP